MDEAPMSEEAKTADTSNVTAGPELTEHSPKGNTDDLAESADSESVQLCAARKIMREYSETLKMLANS
jgi:hypothetical protein